MRTEMYHFLEKHQGTIINVWHCRDSLQILRIEGELAWYVVQYDISLNELEVLSRHVKDADGQAGDSARISYGFETARYATIK